MTSDLFTFQGEQDRKRNAPLAERLRPKTLDDFVGQSAILSEGRLLRRAIAADRVGNLLLHGPPGVGKTTLAKIIALNTRSHFSVLNAVLSGLKELRNEVGDAKNRLEKYGLRTILFIDEVHRFNSAQQDALLPWVENGTLTLIGATTENPYFEVNKALVSRSRLFRLQHLESSDLHKLINRALQDSEYGYGSRNVNISQDAANHLVDVANGDARSLLNALELAVESTPRDSEGIINIDLTIAEESIQERAVLYDKQGDAHFDTISAFIKSLRGSDPDAALFWLARMLEAGENPRFIFRRMLIAASEDIGLADPQAIVVVEACAASFERVGLPEGLYLLAQSALYLAATEKSNSVMAFFEAQKAIRSAQRQEVPSHLRDAHRDKATFGDGIGYSYPHNFAEHWVAQQYLPQKLQGDVFWNPSQQGWEGQRRLIILERRAAQLAAAFELAQENPLFLSSGPDTPHLERWIERQLTQDGNRLELLLERLWSGISWQRHDRVLVLGRSLLWAVTPLRSVPEGGVTILANSQADVSRISDQLNLLDPLDRPTLIQQDDALISQITDNLHFEWVGGRIHSEDLVSQKNDKLWDQITKKCTPKSGLRLLFTSPKIGPAEAIAEKLSEGQLNHKEKYLLDDLIDLEKKWLFSNHNESFLLDRLDKLGWKLEINEWEESLQVKVAYELKRRWLKKGSLYYELLVDNASEAHVKLVSSLFESLHGQNISQRLTHKIIAGRLDNM